MDPADREWEERGEGVWAGPFLRGPRNTTCGLVFSWLAREPRICLCPEALVVTDVGVLLN